MTRTRSLLTLIVALALVGVAVALPATAVTDGATNAQTQANETPEASFDRSIYEVDRGETAAFDVTINHTDTVTVVVGGQEKEYVLRANVTDGDGDGRVGVQFDTAAAGSSEDALGTFRDADSVTVVEQTDVDGQLEPGSYGLTVSFNGTQLDAAALAVLETETTNTTTATPTTTANPTTTAAATTTATDGQPGFGVVAALVAVVAALALARR